MKRYTLYSTFLITCMLMMQCKEKETPSEADMTDTVAGPSILIETDDASNYMGDTNRVTVEDSMANADKTENTLKP